MMNTIINEQPTVASLVRSELRLQVLLSIMVRMYATCCCIV